jgi:hypothetical protein
MGVAKQGNKNPDTGHVCIHIIVGRKDSKFLAGQDHSI